MAAPDLSAGARYHPRERLEQHGLSYPPLEGGSKFALRKFRGGVKAATPQTPPRKISALRFEILSTLPQGEGFNSLKTKTALFRAPFLLSCRCDDLVCRHPVSCHPACSVRGVLRVLQALAPLGA